MELLVEEMQKRIYFVRNKRIILDSDLANFYGIPTKLLTRTVRRNPEWFPEEFAFRLLQEEYDALKRSHAFPKLARGEHTKYLPLAFTAQGSVMSLHFVQGKHEVKMALVKAIIPNVSLSEARPTIEKMEVTMLTEIRDALG